MMSSEIRCCVACDFNDFALPNERAKIIAENIYDKAAPVPDLTPSPDRNKFLHEVLALVEATCQELNITLV